MEVSNNKKITSPLFSFLFISSIFIQCLPYVSSIGVNSGTLENVKGPQPLPGPASPQPQPQPQQRDPRVSRGRKPGKHGTPNIPVEVARELARKNAAQQTPQPAGTPPSAVQPTRKLLALPLPQAPQGSALPQPPKIKDPRVSRGRKPGKHGTPNIPVEVAREQARQKAAQQPPQPAGTQPSAVQPIRKLLALPLPQAPQGSALPQPPKIKDPRVSRGRKPGKHGTPNIPVEVAREQARQKAAQQLPQPAAPVGKKSL